jgi:hypothetical protein
MRRSITPIRGSASLTQLNRCELLRGRSRSDDDWRSASRFASARLVPSGKSSSASGLRLHFAVLIKAVPMVARCLRLKFWILIGNSGNQAVREIEARRAEIETLFLVLCALCFVVALTMCEEVVQSTKHTVQSSNSFDNHRDALPTTYTRGRQSISSAAPV